MVPLRAVFPTLLAAVTVAASAGECTGVLDCQLNGACVDGKCVCNSAWTGANCSRLNLVPATLGQGFYSLDSNWSSWGNAVRQDPRSGQWFMAADEMANDCGLQVWQTGSRCVLAAADRPQVSGNGCFF